jgi:ABC-type glycerol-3-phosphate transport system substrate-binding protein
MNPKSTSSGPGRTRRRRGWLRLASAAGALGMATGLVVSGAAVSGAAVSGVAATGRPASAAGARGASSGSQCGSLTIWTDATRLPAVKDYEKAHPCVKVTATIEATNLQPKIGLFNKEGSGWPDLLWDPGTPDAGWLDSTQYHYAAVLNHGLVPQSEISQWAYNSLDVCKSNGDVYCLRNDIAADVLWYNAPLMKKFGYSIPTTWAQWAKIGEEVAKQHPGYVIGTVGDAYDDEVYFWGSGCPSNELLGTMKVEVNMSSPDCTRMADLLDPLVKDGSVSTLSITSSDFAKKYGDNNHLLMEIGATWYGQYIFQADFHPAKGAWGASYPLTWPGFHDTGDIGGGIWEVSSHAPTATQQLAAAAAYWLCTAPAYQATAPTYPANRNAAKIWVKGLLASHDYANSNIVDVFEAASNEIWPGYSFLLFNPGTVWGDTVVPALVSGKSMSAELPAWQTAMTDQAKSFGYTVVNS